METFLDEYDPDRVRNRVEQGRQSGGSQSTQPFLRHQIVESFHQDGKLSVRDKVDGRIRRTNGSGLFRETRFDDTEAIRLVHEIIRSYLENTLLDADYLYVSRYHDRQRLADPAGGEINQAVKAVQELGCGLDGWNFRCCLYSAAMDLFLWSSIGLQIARGIFKAAGRIPAESVDTCPAIWSELNWLGGRDHPDPLILLWLSHHFPVVMLCSADEAGPAFECPDSACAIVVDELRVIRALWFVVSPRVAFCLRRAPENLALEPVAYGTFSTEFLDSVVEQTDLYGHTITAIDWNEPRVETRQASADAVAAVNRIMAKAASRWLLVW
jgi:hypothetical protein